jgi:ribosomal protein S18 acetylase RimI-like enzyme
MATTLKTTIRPAEYGDEEAVRMLWRGCGLPLADRSEWDALTDGDAAMVLLAEHDSHLVGSAVATFDGWRAFIYHVAVAEPYRGQGVGQNLMAAAQHYLVTAGAREAYVHVHEENTAGLALAVTSGYLPEGERVLVKLLERG